MNSQDAASVHPVLPDGHHIYMCSICGASWLQLVGTDPQTHKPGCPNAREGDDVADA